MKQLHETGLLHEAAKGNHEIHNHFNKLKDANIGDLQLREQIGRLSPFVQSLTEIDKDGQQLRYVVGKQGQASLANRSLANLRVIRESLRELSDVLQSLKRRTYSLCEERRTGTFTSCCSRSDLMDIAKELATEPDRRGLGYSHLRNELKNRYGLGNKTLNDAISVIDANREMGSLLGKEFDLKHLTDEKVWFIVACWTKQHPPRPFGAPRTRILTSADLRREMRFELNSGEIVRELLSGLTAAEMADLSTVFYLARDRYFPEMYDQLYEQTSREYAACDDLFENSSNILSKTNLLKELSRGLTLLGRRNLAAEIWASRPDLH